MTGSTQDSHRGTSPFPVHGEVGLPEARRVYRALRTLSAANRSMLRAVDEADLLREMCRVIVELGGYRMAWVGYAQHDEKKFLKPMAHAGFEAGFLQRDDISWGDAKRSTAATAINTGKPCIGRNILTDPNFYGWREQALKLGYASVSSYPLIIDDVVLGNLTIFSTDPEAFDTQEAELLGELAADLAFGISSLRNRREKQRAEQALERIAYFDSVTGLPNRARLTQTLSEAIEIAAQRGSSLAVLVLNIDQFREINQVIGYSQADKLLHDVGRRLQSAAPVRASLAKVGADEFALLLPEGDTKQGAALTERVFDALNEPFEVAGIKIDVRMSIGLAEYPSHGADADSLIARAGTAMFDAKRSRAGFAVYRIDLEGETPRRLALISDLHRVIDDSHLMLYCQPKVEIRSRTLCGVEALVRWRHPQHGFIPPEQFIPLAEQTGLIRPLTYWMVDAALAQARAWHERGLTISIAVNISARSLQDPLLPDRLAGMLANWGADPRWLQLELTESDLMEDPTRSLQVLLRLRGMGIKLFIDDFGTGFSSLSYLHRLPIDAVKIDKSFTRDVATAEDSRVIVRSIIDLAHNLGFEVVAEGVEDHAAWEQLADMGCDVAQGYYISEPMAGDELLAWCEHAIWCS